jgi:hypothetical protein
LRSHSPFLEGFEAFEQSWKAIYAGDQASIFGPTHALACTKFHKSIPGDTTLDKRSLLARIKQRSERIDQARIDRIRCI